MEPPRSVAVVLLSAIGDVVHGLPIVRSMRRAWPDARITWVIQPAAYELIRGHPEVDEFIVFDRSAGFPAFRDFRKSMSGRHFDLVVDLQVYLKAGFLTAMLPSTRKLGFDRPRARDLNWLVTTERIRRGPPQHVQDQYVEFLSHLGVPPVMEWDFFFSDEERAARDEFFGQIDGPTLAVVVGTTRPAKNWPSDRYAEVLDHAAREYGLRPVLVGGESDLERRIAAEIQARLSASTARPVHALRNDLRRLAWLLDGADYLLSPDTGPLHVAVALGTPTVGLYGYTDPKRVGPYRRFRELTVDLYTRPGEIMPSTEFRPGNMERITASDVVEKLDLAVRRFPVRG
jgi:heptosyltransferase I